MMPRAGGFTSDRGRVTGEEGIVNVADAGRGSDEIAASNQKDRVGRRV
jgi:hypothetical protein